MCVCVKCVVYVFLCNMGGLCVGCGNAMHAMRMMHGMYVCDLLAAVCNVMKCVCNGSKCVLLCYIPLSLPSMHGVYLRIYIP